MEMTAFLDLFSGIGGFALSAYWAGLRFDRHYFSEVDPYAAELYQKRFPEAEPLGDIKNADYAKLPKGEWLVTAGFPCQPHSVAGKRQGFQDERDLWPECARMLRELRPAVALFENVRGLFTSPGKERKGEFFNRILSDISRSGYDAEWQVISALDAGAPHLRKRIWIVCYPCEGGCKGVSRGRPEQEPSDGHLQLETRALAYAQEQPWAVNRQTSSFAGRCGYVAADTEIKRCGNRNDSQNKKQADREINTFTNSSISGRKDLISYTDNPAPARQRKHGREIYAEPESKRPDEYGRERWWATEPDVGRSFDGLSRWLDEFGGLSDGAKKRAGKILRDVRYEILQKAYQWTAGRFDGICKEEVLFSFLCEYEERGIGGRFEMESGTDEEGLLRNLWRNIEAARSPYRRKYSKQYAGEYSDALRSVSCQTSSLFPQAWENGSWEDGIPRTASGVPFRVDRLKGCGNAVVPQCAEMIFNLPAFDLWRAA